MALAVEFPAHLAAIDAGSNAIRLVIARVHSPEDIHELETERAPVRLGHLAFTERRLDRETIARAARAFRHFRRLMEQYRVASYRAVATSAAREARNRSRLVERIRRSSGIELQVIRGAEEARLVRCAVLRVLAGHRAPRLILDLGGGSLELSYMRGSAVERTVGLPLGTVRLMETYGIRGTLSEAAAEDLRRHVLAVLETADLPAVRATEGAVAACGGNAEALAELAVGPRLEGIATLNLRLLRDRLWNILRLDVPARMRTFGVRRDRAEVMGIAGVVLSALGDSLRLEHMLVPRVGVREGILLDLAAARGPQVEVLHRRSLASQALLDAASRFLRRFPQDPAHAEQVRRLAISLFDQLEPLKRGDGEERELLRAAAILHDVGQAISRKSHHRHGEYMVMHSDLPGLRGWRRNFVAALVRYHNNKSEPSRSHPAYGALARAHQSQVRRLSALLRIAEKLETDHRNRIARLEVEIRRRAVVLWVHVNGGAPLRVAGVLRKAALFEKEFHRELLLHRAPARQGKAKAA